MKTHSVPASLCNGPVGQLVVLALVGAILVSMVPERTQASPMPMPVAAVSEAGQHHGHSSYNNIDNLIFDLLDDKVKKSRMNSARQIKQTLRFGRRSDPLMSPSILAEELAYENEREQNN